MKRWLIVVALVACNKQDATPEAKPKPAPVKVDPKPAADAAVPAAAADCEARVKKLADRLGVLAKEKPGMLPMVLPADLALAASPLGKPIDAPGVVVVVTKDDKVSAAGNTVSLKDGTRLLDEVFWRRALEAMHMDRGPKKPWPLYVWADKNVKVASLAKLFADEIYKDFKLRLLVEGDTKSADAAILDKPSVKKVHDSLPKEELPAMEARAKELRASTAGCDTLPMAFAKASTEAGPINELTVMTDNVSKALIECKCNLADWDVFEYAMYSVFGSFHPTPRYIELPKLAAKDKRTVADLAVKP